MSKADEIFEELGYKNIPKTNQMHNIFYFKDKDNVLYFDRKTIRKSGEYHSMCKGITMDELQAINEKVKELKWI